MCRFPGNAGQDSNRPQTIKPNCKPAGYWILGAAPGMRALRKDRVGLERSLTTLQQTHAMVPAPGLEPGWPKRPRDFKSFA